MAIQERPICWDCTTTIESNDMVFEAPCGHDGCPSVVFHPLCLMSWREKRGNYAGVIVLVRKRWEEGNHG